MRLVTPLDTDVEVIPINYDAIAIRAHIYESKNSIHSEASKVSKSSKVSIESATSSSTTSSSTTSSSTTFSSTTSSSTASSSTASSSTTSSSTTPLCYPNKSLSIDPYLDSLGNPNSLDDPLEIDILAIDRVLPPHQLTDSIGLLVGSPNDLASSSNITSNKSHTLSSTSHVLSSIIPPSTISASTICEWNCLPIKFLIIMQVSHTAQLAIQLMYPRMVYCPRPLLGFVRACISSANRFQNMLIDPLQPLRDDLDLEIYAQFEKDPRKYLQYKDAMELAIADLADQKALDNSENSLQNWDENSLETTSHNKSITTRQAHSSSIEILVVGPGTGKLIDMLFTIHSDFHVVAIEKNSKCVEVLQQKNHTEWGGNVDIIFGDVREIPESQLSCPDIVVSELLGSFGDNELSPEILLCFDKSSAIVIPSSYTSYLRPIYSPIINGKSRPYLCQLTKYRVMADFQPVWDFNHPGNTSMVRSTTLVFTNSGPTTEINGFQGYFCSNLYAHIKICIMKEDCATDEYCNSWYPIIFPINCTTLHHGDTISLSIKRETSASRVWYQWSAGGIVYNANGQEYNVDLNTKTE